MLEVSYGGGVNSTAMILHLLDTEPENMADARIVFADTGAEWPETYAYVHQFDGWLQQQHGLRIEWVSEGNLIDYCMKCCVLPYRVNRFCTRIFKAVPIARWKAELPQHGLVECIGYSAEEKHRSESPRIMDAVIVGRPSDRLNVPWERWERHPLRFPLIEANIDREGCAELIAGHGLEVPPKSGCYICSFQRVGEWRRLWQTHPDLFAVALELEEATNERRAAENKKPVALCGNKLLRDRAEEWEAGLVHRSVSLR